MKNIRLCSKCILTDKTPGINFNNNGVCNYCRDYEPMKTETEEKLREILDRFRNPNRKYECMVCISGGRDSTYVLWKMVHDYKMKVLSVTYNNPFQSEQARKNIESAVKKLHVDHIYWEFPNEIHKKTTKKHLKIWTHKPSSIMIPFVCAHCKSWNFNFFQIARKNKIPLIIFGSNPLETASFKKGGLKGARTYHKLSNLPKIIAKSCKELILNPNYLTANWDMVLKMYLGASHSTPYMRWRYKDITVIRLFDYLKWNEKEVESIIEKHLEWKKSPEVKSHWRFDCRLDYVRRLMYSSTIGVTELRDLFSKMIREGLLTRNEALDRLKKEEPIQKTVLEDVLSDLDLKLSDLNLKIEKELLLE